MSFLFISEFPTLPLNLQALLVLGYVAMTIAFWPLIKLSAITLGTIFRNEVLYHFLSQDTRNLITIRSAQVLLRLPLTENAKNNIFNAAFRVWMQTSSLKVMREAKALMSATSTCATVTSLG